MKTIFLFYVISFFSLNLLHAQTTVAFQGGEGSASDTWGFATINSAGGATPPGIVSVNARSGTKSIRAGGGNNTSCTGGSNCITGGSNSATGCSMHDNVITFNSINTACLSGVQLTCYHSSHSCGGSGGSGFDNGESLFFEVSLNGGSWTTVGTLTGGADLQWNYTNTSVGGVANPFVYSVPAGTNTFQFRVRASINRSDEVFYLDDVKLTTSTSTYSFPGTSGLWGGYTSTDWFNACNWSNRSIPTSTVNVVFPSNNTGSKDIVINANTNPTCNNLTINGSGSKQIKGEGSATKKLTINGNLTIASTDGLDFSDGSSGTADGVIEIYGNWINNGVESDFKEGNSTVNFLGSSNQTISTADAEEAFYILNINKPSGTVTMNDDVWIDKDFEGGTSSLLIFSQGKLDLNSNELKIWNDNEQAVSRTSGGVISEDTDNSSKMTWYINNNTGAHVFPFIRTDNFYIPFTFNLTAGNVDDVTVSTFPTAANNTPFPSSPQSVTNVNDGSGNNNSTNMVNRFWQIDKTGSSGTANLTFTYGDNEWDVTEPSNYEANRWSSGSWQVATGTQSQNLSSNSVSVSGITAFSPWTLVAPISSLPIELLDFSVYYNLSNKVDVLWSTASEKNNDFFTVERSTDAVSFNELYKIKGAGNSLRKTDYAVVDEHPEKGISYYRLKQTDRNGIFTYSQIQSVSSNDHQGFSIYPNPNESGALKILNDSDSGFDITLTDVFGRVVFNGHSVTSFTELDLTTFSKGVYFISLISKKQNFSSKIIYH